MNTLSRLALSAASLLAVSITVHAQGITIYTWTDQDGVVHYVDTPPDNPAAVAIDAPEAYRPGTQSAYEETGAAAVAEGAETAEGEEPEAFETYADEQRALMAAKREKAEAARLERERLCAEARQQVAKLEPSRRVFFTNSEGETERLDDEERVRMIEEAKELVDQNCY